MKKGSDSREQTARVTFPLALLLIMMVAVVAAKSIHAQCTRSCGQPPPHDAFSVLHNFTGAPDGANSVARLVEDAAGNFYGTTSQGGITGGACGSVGCGIAFKVDQVGNETVLHSFAGQPDGATPLAGLVLDAAGNMYGTTSLGGMTNLGTVFKLDSTGTETVLYSFTGEPDDGAQPAGDLVLDATGNLLGTTSLGGIAGAGTVFKLDSAGKESALYSFGGEPDGSTPMAGLILDDKGNMYGTTFEGGAGPCNVPKRDRSTPHATCGVVFELDTTGTETVLHSFTGEPDGANPAGDLVRDATGNLYGTTAAGGIVCIIIAPALPGQGPSTEFNCGTVFKLDPTGKETLLHTFNGAPDGAIPDGALILDVAGNLYGTTSQGGAGGCWVSSGFVGSENLGCGSIFEVATAGSATVLYSFTGTGLDWAPKAGLALDPSGNVFGTTTQGGVAGGECTDFGCGVVFKFAANVNRPDAAAPTFSPPGGTYNSTQTVTISDATANAAIYYTADGSTPTTSSTLYAGAITVSSSEAIQTFAAATGFANSSIASADYTISGADFSLTAASSDLPLAAGGQQTDVITISPQNGAFANPIQLTCAVTGPSPAPTCSLSSASVTLGAKAATATLTITAPTASAAQMPSQQVQPGAFAYAAWLPLASVLAAVGGSKKRIRRRWALGGSLLLLLVLQSACGGGTTTGQTSYTVTVTAASGAIQHTTQVGVTLR